MMVTGTITSKSMITIPANIKRKYGFKEGGKVAFIEQDIGVLMVPRKNLIDYYGVDEAHAEELKQAIRELEEEHRREAREE
jgi:bifunctional DNA-binding transcriptional regulator/antitoxin component of YhaV-PrlF toxin-antitoxin module